MSLDPLEMLRRDEADLIPCAGGCGYMLDPHTSKLGDKCLLCDPDQGPKLFPLLEDHREVFNCRCEPEPE